MTDALRAWAAAPTSGDDKLGAGIAGTLLAGAVVGRFHALRDVVEPVVSFAERLPQEPASWADDRIVARALAFLEEKGLLTPREFGELTDSMRQAAFTIAGVTRKTALKAALASLTDSLERGLSVAAAADRLNAALVDAGYSALRPTHAALVAEQNYLQAYGASSYQALKDPRVRGILPYFQYVTRNDERVRPTHRVLHNLIFARSNPIWNRIWPPNGFRCRCIVRGVTVTSARLYGITEDDVPPGAASVPDKGFRSNPGQYLRRMRRAA